MEEKHRYWANCIGFIAFLAFLLLGFKCCADYDIDDRKLKIEKQNE